MRDGKDRKKKKSLENKTKQNKILELVITPCILMVFVLFQLFLLPLFTLCDKKQQLQKWIKDSFIFHEAAVTD